MVEDNRIPESPAESLDGSPIPKLTEEEIDVIDLRAESEDALFDDGKDTVETEDEARIPVSYESVEEALLAMFIQDDAIAMLIAQSGLRDIHFLKRKNKIMFPILLSVRYTKGVCTFDLVADQLEKETMQDGQSALDSIGGFPELTKIIACTPAVMDLKVAQGYIDIIFEQFKLSKVKEAARWIVAQRKFDEPKVVDKVSELQQVIADDTLSRHGLVSIDVLANDSFERYKDRRLHPEKHVGIKTGFYWIDKYQVIARKHVCVLGSKTTIGKSVLISNMVTKILLGDFRILLFTPELDREEYIDRLLCALAGVEIDAYKDASIGDADVDKIGEAKSKLLNKAHNLYIEDRGSQSCGFILNSIRKHLLNHQVDVVVVDYLQILRYYGDNTKRAITDMMEKFCSFGKDNNIAFIIASQLKRTDDSEPKISDLKESGDIENFADSVILLHRNSTTKHGERNKGWYRVEKNRQGRVTENVALIFHEQFLKFTEKDIPEEGVDAQGTLISGYDDNIPDEERPTEQTVVEKIVEEQGTL